MQVFVDFFHKKFLDKGNNATYISLIPKKEGVEEIGDFRSTYKIISKCLTTKLKVVLQ